ncbi:LOW QUALITY PROTEIN: quinone oxidoreductase PIG3-like [Liolophura sinensis]|uniref:LOW QUALITY PROTEIN: quinone oxidoreductase PIG3-like n=1 Tax=Liolophura sinensis TaxID=3198878 RepID=UPI0031586C47
MTTIESFATLLCILIFSVLTISSLNMRAAHFQPGGPELLGIEETDIPTLKRAEVLIRVVCTAINRADTLQRKGGYPPPPGASEILGLEAAGMIHQLGPDCMAGWKVGDRVMALLPGGGNAEYVAAHEDQLIAIPSGMSFDTAAAIPETWLTAFQLLHTIGKVQAGDWVLIHAGGSGVGTAAIQLSLLAGAKPIVTAGSQAKIETAKSLGAVAGFNYKEGDFSEKVTQATGGSGANLILDCVVRSFWEQNVKLIAVDGRWVSYGLLGGPKVEGNLLGFILRKRIQLDWNNTACSSNEVFCSPEKHLQEWRNSMHMVAHLQGDWTHLEV